MMMNHAQPRKYVTPSEQATSKSHPSSKLQSVSEWSFCPPTQHQHHMMDAWRELPDASVSHVFGTVYA